MDQKPLVSVIMPSYNTEKYIAKSIDSVLRQTYQNWELIITVNPSIDRTAIIAKEYCERDPRIHLITPDQHQGIAEARQTSIQQARGRYLAFLDSDDIWVHEKLEKQVKFMQDNDLAFTYGDYEIIDTNGKPTGKIIHNDGIVDYNKYLKNTIIGCGSVMLDKEKVGEIKAPSNEVNDDMGLWCSIMRRGVVAYPLGEVLYQYRVRNDGTSSQRMKMVKSVWMVYRKQERLPLSKSIWCFLCYAFNATKKRLA